MPLLVLPAAPEPVTMPVVISIAPEPVVEACTPSPALPVTDARNAAFVLVWVLTVVVPLPPVTEVTTPLVAPETLPAAAVLTPTLPPPVESTSMALLALRPEATLVTVLPSPPVTVA